MSAGAEKRRIRFTLFTDKVGSSCETYIDVDAEDWDDLDAAGRDEYAKEMFWDAAMDRIGGWEWEAVE